MNIRVVYHTRTGNTKLVAEAIADAVGATAEPIASAHAVAGADLLFLGDGLYAGTIDKKTKRFIESLDPSSAKTAAVFSTFGGQDKAGDILKSLLHRQGITVRPETFGCKGKAWWILNRGHPSSRDLHSAREFALSMVETCKKQ
jgi:flavodoxin